MHKMRKKVKIFAAIFLSGLFTYKNQKPKQDKHFGICYSHNFARIFAINRNSNTEVVHPLLPSYNGNFTIYVIRKGVFETRSKSFQK
jgi:hypothetical protein